MAAARRAKREPTSLISVLTSAARLPPGDTLRFAAAVRLHQLLSACDGDTRELARRLRVTPRTAQRLRAAFGVVGPRGHRTDVDRE